MVTPAKSYYKNLLYLISGNTIGQVFPFLLAPFIARLYSPEELGVQENFLALVSVIAIVASARYEFAFVLPKDSVKANNLFILAFIILLIMCFISSTLLIFPEKVEQFYEIPELGKFLFLVIPALFFNGVSNLFMQWLSREGKFNWISAGRMTQSIVQNGGYVLAGYLNYGVYGLIVAWIVGNIIPVLLLSFPVMKRLQLRDVNTTGMIRVAKEFKDFPMINSAHAFMDIFATQFLLYWLITKNYGALCLGLFAIMTRYLRAPLNVVGSAISQLYFKEASDKKNQDLNIEPVFKQSIKIIVIVILPVLLIVAFLGPQLFAWYLGEAWRDAGKYAQIFSPAIFFSFLASVVSTTPLIANKQKQAFILSVLGYIVSLGSIFIASKMGLSFDTMIWIYSIALSVYYLGMFFWYKKLNHK